MIEECFNCGISEEEVKLFSAIGKEGIIKICEDCAERESIPIIKKSEINKDTQFNINKKESVYERLSRLSGFKPKEQKPEREKERLKQQNTSLKELIDKNYYKNISKEPKPDFLIDNFHWKIMRVRRLKHLTQGELAKEINEPEAAIKTIEKGLLPRGCDSLINKIEKYLDIVITREEFRQKENNTAKISFDPIETKEITIGELRSIHNKKEISEELDEDFDEEIEEDFDFEDEE